jgi:tetratricopeptide (TPR) repeat protein
MNDSKKELLSLLNTFSLIVTAIFFFTYPLVFTIATTDAFAIPKQAILILFVVISFILLGVRMLVLGKIRFRTTPFDLPLLLFVVICGISAFLSINRFDSLIAFAPLLYAVIAYYLITNSIRGEKSIVIVTAALVAGGTIASISALLSYFKIFVLPWTYTQSQAFSPMGSLLDQALFLAMVLPLAGYIASPILGKVGQRFIRRKDMLFEADRTTDEASGKLFAFGVAFIIMLAGLVVTVIQLATTQRPLILPFETGFQTAFAAISQDQGRVLLSFLFGSGWGTFMTDFTRFKSQAYNLNPTLWSFTFFRSSSFVLELLATTGFLGTASYLFLVYRILRERVFFIPVILGIIASFILPFSYVILLTFIIVLAIFAGLRSMSDQKEYSDLDFYFVAAKGHEGVRYASILPVLVVIVVGGLLAAVTYFAVRFGLSDITFQRALVAASQNNGAATYDLQRQAIGQFPYRDSYYRIFSQTNLALANSLASSQPQGSSPSAEVQNNILTLIQQSINSGRTAVNISPLTSLNWNNLSSVYRSLIGFGENAEQFAIVTNQQAIALDPNNPQQYINLGGIYYQMQNWPEAQRQFQIAVTLKPDYANAYYNLGHTLENQNQLQNALQAYQAVKTLVANQPENVEQINKEIAALEKKIGGQSSNTQPDVTGTAENQPGLDVEDTPEAQLPERDPRAEIQGPPSGRVTPSPTQADEDEDAKTTITPSPSSKAKQ